MAVFTPVSDDQAREFLAQYNLGTFVSLRGISAGIENSNFFLTTTEGDFVLTIFEVLSAEELPFYIELMHHLATRGVPVPQPQTRMDGARLSSFAGKPAAIVTRLPGEYEPHPTSEHCALAGATLARAHLAARDLALTQPNLRGLPWIEKTVPMVLPFLSAELSKLLLDSLEDRRRLAMSTDYQALPAGPAHCDLFRDNVLFSGSPTQPIMGGLIDFYFAGCETWLFDVAVCLNDWCIDLATGRFDLRRVNAWLVAYAALRPFTEAERRVWPAILRAAALRFWLSRLYDFYLPRPAQTLKAHDPEHFERILVQRTIGVNPDLPKEV